MAGVEPAVVGMAEAVEGADIDHVGDLGRVEGASSVRRVTAMRDPRVRAREASEESDTFPTGGIRNGGLSDVSDSPACTRCDRLTGVSELIRESKSQLAACRTEKSWIAERGGRRTARTQFAAMLINGIAAQRISCGRASEV